MANNIERSTMAEPKKMLATAPTTVEFLKRTMASETIAVKTKKSMKIVLPQNESLFGLYAGGLLFYFLTSSNFDGNGNGGAEKCFESDNGRQVEKYFDDFNICVKKYF
mmetsp:Transcript_45888/g.89656  ORF Transcript_45888/g.89656 Transcript_45888/m.89656 type:complete len:108 (+) Transcript_45888:178-501(+)